ncbi:MAG: hypothetical protein LBS75_01720 [Synergistaceae bacterium]|jgi:hypothetical protein|nr:hypothetical protein [Synergistaceae bacterium]
MDMVEAAFNAYLSGDSDEEIAFLEGCLGLRLPRRKPVKIAGMWPMRAERVLGKSGERAAERFRTCYAALKGLFLFWIDYKLFEAARESDNPHVYRERLNSITQRHCAGDRRKIELFNEIHGKYTGFTNAYLEHSASHGPLDGGVEFERSAFQRAFEPSSDVAGQALEKRMTEYFLSSKKAIFGWLDMLRGNPARSGEHRPRPIF